MTIKELVKHILPEYPVKIKVFETGVIIEQGLSGDYQDSKDWFYEACEVKDWTVFKKYVDILI